MSRIGEWIRLNRLEADLTQSALGDEVGVHGSVVSQWENGHQDPSSESMELLERFFGRTFKGDGARGGDEEAASETDLKRLRDEIGTDIGCIGTFDPEDEGSIPNHPGIYVLYSDHNNQLTSHTMQKLKIRIKAIHEAIRDLSVVERIKFIFCMLIISFVFMAMIVYIIETIKMVVKIFK